MPDARTRSSVFTVALVGRPNAGKSSLYNRITGGDAHVGNFPGITIDVLECDVALSSGRSARVVDLPGLYSLNVDVDPETDEGIARRFLDAAEARAPDALLVVQVLDATQLGLGLRLTRELIQRGSRLLVVATQFDNLGAEGRLLDVVALETALGVRVVTANSRDPSTRAVVLAAIDEATGQPRRARDVPAWDPDALALSVTREAATVDVATHRRRTRTSRFDAVLLHPVVGPVLFGAIMTLMFAAVYFVADPATSACDSAVQRLGAWVTSVLGHGLVASFVSDGVLGGAGTVLAFLPQIVILTVAMELLEASGYLARGAFLVDRALRLVGLGGRAFVPLLTAHACAVPAVAATRIMRDPRERLGTILVLPLMTCSARIPTYSLLISTFLVTHGAWFKSMVFVGLYFAGVFSAMLASMLIRRTATRGRRLPLVLEMPPYRAPESRAVLRVAGRAARRFVRDVGGNILVVSVILWVLLTVPMPHFGARSMTGEAPRTRIERSVAAGVGRALEPVTRPIGFDWRLNVGLIGSFGARELMVSTLGVIFGLEDVGDDATPLRRRMLEARDASGRRSYSVATAFSLMAFFVLACQCMSTVAAIRRETRTWRWPAFVLAYTYAAAFVASLVVYQFAKAVGLA